MLWRFKRDLSCWSKQQKDRKRLQVWLIAPSLLRHFCLFGTSWRWMDLTQISLWHCFWFVHANRNIWIFCCSSHKTMFQSTVEFYFFFHLFHINWICLAWELLQNRLVSKCSIKNKRSPACEDIVNVTNLQIFSQSLDAIYPSRLF